MTRLARAISGPGAAHAALRAELLLAPLPPLVFGAWCASRGGPWLLGTLPAAAVLAAAALAVGRMTPAQARVAAAHASTALAALAFVGFAVLPLAGLYRTETVLSGSMRPAFSPGDVIVVTSEPASAVRVGQVISYAIPVDDHHVVSHRVVKVVSGGLRPVVVTKGDANPAADPWQARLLAPVVWRYRATLPGLGWPIVVLRQPVVRAALLYGATSLLTLLLLLRLWFPQLADRLGRAARRADA